MRSRVSPAGEWAHPRFSFTGKTYRARLTGADRLATAAVTGSESAIQHANTTANPAQIVERRRKQRPKLRGGQRRIMVLELIADTLETVSLDFADAVSMLESDTHDVRHG